MGGHVAAAPSRGELGADHSVQADVLLGGFEGGSSVDFRGDPDHEFAAVATLAYRLRHGFAVGLHVGHDLGDDSSNPSQSLLRRGIQPNKGWLEVVTEAGPKRTCWGSLARWGHQQQGRFARLQRAIRSRTMLEAQSGKLPPSASRAADSGSVCPFRHFETNHSHTLCSGTMLRPCKHACRASGQSMATRRSHGTHPQPRSTHTEAQRCREGQARIRSDPERLCASARETAHFRPAASCPALVPEQPGGGPVRRSAGSGLVSRRSSPSPT